MMDNTAISPTTLAAMQTEWMGRDKIVYRRGQPGCRKARKSKKIQRKNKRLARKRK